MSGDLRFNKYAAAILATALGFMVIKEISHGAIHVDKKDGFAYCDECASEAAPKTGPKEPELPFPQEAWIAAMDVEYGKESFKACETCHTVDKGGKASTGPNLWNIVGRPAGTVDGYAYSSAMKSSGVTWNYEELDKFLERPAKYVPGTKMGYAGAKEKKRAAMIAYLRSLSDNPLPLPVAAAAPAPADDMIQDMAAPGTDMEKKPMEVVIDDKKMEPPASTPQPVIEEKMESVPDVKPQAVIEEKVMEAPTIAPMPEKAAEIVQEVGTIPAEVTEKVEDMVPAIEVSETPAEERAIEMVEDKVEGVVQDKVVQDKIEQIVPIEVSETPAQEMGTDLLEEKAQDVVEDKVEDLVEEKVKEVVTGDQ